MYNPGAFKAPLRSKADTAFQHELGDGLLQRWATLADAERIAQLLGVACYSPANLPPEPGLIDQARRPIAPPIPLMAPGNYAVIEDSRKPGRPIVACASLASQRWLYEGLPFAVGRPEKIAIDPGYRQRGLVRMLFEMLHARSQSRGDLAQAITGIPYHYRQLGYEYALDLNSKRVADVECLPLGTEEAVGSFKLRPATLADIPQLEQLYNQRRAGSMIWNDLPADYWRRQIERGERQAGHGELVANSSQAQTISMIVDRSNIVCGYTVVAARRWTADLQVQALELVPGLSWEAQLPALLRMLRDYGRQLAAGRPEIEPFRRLSFSLGGSHPVYQMISRHLVPLYEPPYAWYMRVPDLTAFVRQIAPVLERRLAGSALAGHSGELTISFYRGGLRLALVGGRLTAIEPWDTPPFSNDAQVTCPALIFLKLLFGYRSLRSLRNDFPDIMAGDEAELLLEILFPTMPSWVLPA